MTPVTCVVLVWCGVATHLFFFSWTRRAETPSGHGDLRRRAVTLPHAVALGLKLLVLSRPMESLERVLPSACLRSRSVRQSTMNLDSTARKGIMQSESAVTEAETSSSVTGQRNESNEAGVRPSRRKNSRGGSWS